VLEGQVLRRLHRTLAIERLAERVDDATDQLIADGNLRDATRRPDGVAFLEVLVLTHDDRAHAILPEVEREAEHRLSAGWRWELKQFTGHGLLQSVDARNAVTDRRDHALVGVDDRGVEAGNALLQDVADLVTAYGHGRVVPLSLCGGCRCRMGRRDAHQTRAVWSC